MSVETVSRTALLDAALAVLNADLGAMATPRAAYEYGKTPATGGDYVIVGVSRMFGGNERIGGLASTSWRLTVRAVGTARNVGVLLSRCTNALEERSFTAGGVQSSPLRFETETSVVQDDDDLALYSGLRSFTFAF